MPRRTPGPASRRLTKAEAVTLVTSYDDDPVAALSSALRALSGRPDATWPELVAAAPFTPSRRAALLTGEQGALDDLLGELNELRTVAPPTGR